MQLHELSPVHKAKKKKRIGRGGKRGTYSGRGQKGQLSRAGHKMPPVIRELIKKYPKLKGYRSRKSPDDVAVVNLGALSENFTASEIVTPKSLLEKGLIRRIDGRTPKVKILGEGKLTKKLTVRGCDVSDKAREALGLGPKPPKKPSGRKAVKLAIRKAAMKLEPKKVEKKEEKKIEPKKVEKKVEKKEEKPKK